jgi:hypothetical protein
MLACYWDHPAVVEVLIAGGADPQIRSHTVRANGD